MAIAELETKITVSFIPQQEYLEVEQVNGIVPGEEGSDPETIRLITAAKERRDKRFILTQEGRDIRNRLMRTLPVTEQDLIAAKILVK